MMEASSRDLAFVEETIDRRREGWRQQGLSPSTIEEREAALRELLGRQISGRSQQIDQKYQQKETSQWR
jgi:hypothetical protein